MCIGRLFGGGRRHRSNAVTESSSMPASQANVAQVSVENVRVVKSAKSIKSGNTAAGSRSVNTVASEARKSGLVGSGGSGGAGASVAPNDIPTSASVLPNTGGGVGPASGSAAAVSNSRSVRRTSWWGYFGMNKKKNSSIESL